MVAGWNFFRNAAAWVLGAAGEEFLGSGVQLDPRRIGTLRRAMSRLACTDVTDRSFRTVDAGHSWDRLFDPPFHHFNC